MKESFLILILILLVFSKKEHRQKVFCVKGPNFKNPILRNIEMLTWLKAQVADCYSSSDNNWIFEYEKTFKSVFGRLSKLNFISSILENDNHSCREQTTTYLVVLKSSLKVFCNMTVI